MLESDFNSALRRVLRLQGLRVIHIVEADETGVSDLEVWLGNTILAWMELKVDNEKLRPSQVEFLRERDRESGNAFVVRLAGNTGVLSVERPPLVTGWSTDNKDLMVLHRTMRHGDFDWGPALSRWKRTRR